MRLEGRTAFINGEQQRHRPGHRAALRRRGRQGGDHRPKQALLDVELDERTSTRVSGSIGADKRHHQPWGIVHEGLYPTGIETFATLGAYEAVKDRGQQAVGASNTTDFLRPHLSGRLEVVAGPIQQGRTQQLRQVEVGRPEDDKLVARGQVRLQNIEAGA